jgi:hypothetical protein
MLKQSETPPITQNLPFFSHTLALCILIHDEKGTKSKNFKCLFIFFHDLLSLNSQFVEKSCFATQK